jgi:RNA polymerase sigma-70 factor (ECF subfamily)
MLDTTTPAVKSALQRARARLEQETLALEHVTALTEPDQEALLQRYIAAFENADAAALEQLLRQDATLEATPLRTWLAGLRTCLPYLVAHVLGSPGDWQMAPTRANGQPAAVAYQRGLPYGIVVLTTNGSGIAHIHAFGEPGLVSRFAPTSPERL